MEIILTVVALFLAWFLGALYGWHAHTRMVERNIRHFIHAMHEDLNQSMIKIKIERHNDMMYVYDLETNQFMAQGKTEKELTEQLRTKFPGKGFAASNEDIKESGLRNESI